MVMGWIKVTRNRDKQSVWVNTDHMIRVSTFNGNTRIHLTELGKEGSESMLVNETVDQVMSSVQGAGNKIVQTLS